MFGSTSLRLAAVYTAGFSVAVALLGVTTIVSTRAALTQQFDERLRSDQIAVLDGYHKQGLNGLQREMGEASAGAGALLFGVQTEAGAPIQGPLAALRTPVGVSAARLPVGGKMENVRVLTDDLDGRYRLLIGDRSERIEALSQRVLWGFALAFLALLGVGVAGGLALSQAVQRRMSAISGTAEAIIDGDLGRRVPVRGDDDLSRLAMTLNRMLDRNGALMDSLRQVTSDVAHDLRTPLNRLRQRLERSARQVQDPADRAEIEGALGDVDAILTTFAALLRISEVEAGARRAAFRRLDLRALARAVAEDFAPAAEDTGGQLGAVVGRRSRRPAHSERQRQRPRRARRRTRPPVRPVLSPRAQPLDPRQRPWPGPGPGGGATAPGRGESRGWGAGAVCEGGVSGYFLKTESMPAWAQIWSTD